MAGEQRGGVLSVQPPGSSMAASILLLGDSNLSFHDSAYQWWRTRGGMARQWEGSVAWQACRQGNSMAFFPMQQLRLGHREALAILTVVRNLPSPTWAFVHAGQNDADYWSRRSTRTEDLGRTFGLHVRQVVRELERLLHELGILRVMWAMPFDDPGGGLTTEYRLCVAVLVECLRERRHWCHVPQDSDFLEDRYHLNKEGRERYALALTTMLWNADSWGGTDTTTVACLQRDACCLLWGFSPSNVRSGIQCVRARLGEWLRGSRRTGGVAWCSFRGRLAQANVAAN